MIPAYDEEITVADVLDAPIDDLIAALPDITLAVLVEAGNQIRAFGLFSRYRVQSTAIDGELQLRRDRQL